jgi:hypothetical protein
MFAQINAAATAATRTPALPDSVCRNARSGAERPRAHNVRPRHTDALGGESVISAHEAETTFAAASTRGRS